MNKGKSLIRLYVVPVWRDRWVFGVASQPSVFETIVSSQQSHTELSTYLRLKDKALQAFKQAKESFDQISHEDGIKGSLKKMVDGLNKRIDPTESMLKSLSSAYSASAVPKRAATTTDVHIGEEGHVEIVYPSLLGQDIVSQTLPNLIRSRTAKHHQLLFGSTALLPATLAMGILPGNQPFLTNCIYIL